MSIFMPWATGPVRCHFQLQKASHFFGRGLLVRESLEWSTEGARGEHGKTTPSFSCLPIETPVRNILDAPGVVGVGSVCDIQPREELLSNSVLPSGCPQLPVMFCFDDGNSSILCSGGSLCVSRWVYVVCIDFLSNLSDLTSLDAKLTCYCSLNSTLLIKGKGCFSITWFVQETCTSWVQVICRLVG